MLPIPFQKINSDFIKHFKTGIQKFEDRKLTILTKRFQLNIIKFDEYLHKEHGYSENNHGSISDFIVLKFGIDAEKFIKNLI